MHLAEEFFRRSRGLLNATSDPDTLRSHAEGFLAMLQVWSKYSGASTPDVSREQLQQRVEGLRVELLLAEQALESSKEEV